MRFRFEWAIIALLTVLCVEVSLRSPDPVLAQGPQRLIFVTSAPFGSCNITMPLRYVTGGADAFKLYGCASTTNVWGLVSGTGGGGGGNVTSSGTLNNNQLIGGNGAAVIKAVNLTGAVTTSGGLTTVITPVVTAGVYGDASHTLQLTINAAGQVTAVSSLPISPYTGQFTATTGLAVSDTSHSGAAVLSGKTSGGISLAVADAAGTLVGVVLPTAVPMSFPKSLQITGTTTCPTLTSAPATCYATAWQ